VEEGREASLRQLTFNTTNGLNGTTILTTMPRAVSAWDEFNNEWWYYEDIHGVQYVWPISTFFDPFEDFYWNFTLQMDVLINQKYSEVSQRLTLTEGGFRLRTIDGVFFEVTEDYPKWSSQFGNYYYVMPNGTRLDLIPSGDRYQFILGATTYEIWNPWSAARYYTTLVNGTNVALDEWQAQPYFYTTISGVNHQLPYDGVMMPYAGWWVMEHTVDQGGVVPTDYYMDYLGTALPIQKIGNNFFIDLPNGTQVQIFTPNMNTSHTVINGEDAWGLSLVSFAVDLGTLDAGSWNPNNWFIVNETYYTLSHNEGPMGEWYPGFEGKDDLFYINLTNGEKLYATKSPFAIVYEADINGVTVYTERDWIEYDFQTNKHYVIAINGSMIFFDQPHECVWIQQNVVWLNTTYMMANVINYTWAAPTYVQGFPKDFQNLAVTTGFPLNDSSGFYFNLVNGDRFDVTLIENDDLFHSNGAIFNATYNGKSWLIYDFIETINNTFQFDGETLYRHDFNNYEPMVTNYTGSLMMLNNEMFWRTVYEVEYQSSNYTVYTDEQWIFKMHQSWGVPYRWMLEKVEMQNMRQVHSIVLGTPQYGMWGFNVWTTNPENGALDLDGDLETTDDQYFVRRVHVGTDYWTSNMSTMWIGLIWDPDTALQYNELYMDGWMGKASNTWEWSWTEDYIWYYADEARSMEHVTQSDFDTLIKPLLVDNSTGIPNPGYWDIARMAENMTSEEMLQFAQDMGWDWFTDNKQEWEVLWFDFGQAFWTDWEAEGLAHTTWAQIQYQFAGLLLYNSPDDDVMDLDEITHYYLPSHIGGVDFSSPGLAFGDANPNGSMVVAGNLPINFGVSFTDINGTTFPYNQRSYWSWYQAGSYGSDLQTFDERPVDANIELLEFMVHFNTFTEGEANDTNYYANMKIDQNVGNWEVDFPGGRQALENRSLASSYYIYALTGDIYRVLDDTGNQTQNDQVTTSEAFDMAVQDHIFAGVEMGQTYDWVKNTSQMYNTSTSTTPIGAFQSSFQGEGNNKGALGFDFNAEMYFLTLAFPSWDGYGVYCDPALGLAVGKSQHDYAPGQFPGWDLGNPDLATILITAGTIVIIVLVAVIVIKKRRKRAGNFIAAPSTPTIPPPQTSIAPAYLRDLTDE
jgi:hypothetical protein